MATTVDERIVAAKFDASDFEKGVDKTVKKLDELKKSLNFKDATKDVKELAEKTEVSTNSMSKSLEKLTERFTTFTGMIKQKILGGLADEVASVFLRMEMGVKNFIKSISTDQVAAGLDKYQQILTSVRVMVSSGVSESKAYESLDQLTEYVDQTSYSLTQMTDALSKMVSAGTNVDVATKSVQGIANACADAGINAQDAQRAFYNLAQAYGKGKLEYTDYKSLELLNMTTDKFKQNLLDAAVEVGTLKKVSEGVYKTINTKDKKVKAGKKVTKQNMTDMMRYDFVNNKVMDKLFGGKYFFTEAELDKIYEEMGIDDKFKASQDQKLEALKIAKERFGEVAVQAYLAAKEARSFTDVINTIKDAVSTGWAKTFEHLFGKLEVAKDFFTELTEGKLADAIYEIGTWRNEMLESWNDLDAEGQGTGGRMFRESILNTTDALGILIQTFESIAPDASDFGEKMKIMSVRVRNFTIQIKEAAIAFQNWMNEDFVSDGNGGFKSRIDVIREALGHLGSVFGIFAKLGKIAFETLGKVLTTLAPLFDGFIIFLNKFTAPLSELKENTQVFKDIENSIDNILTVLTPIVGVLGQVVGFFGEIGAFFLNLAIDTVTSNISFFADVLGLFLELLGVKTAQMKEGEGVLDKIRKDFEGIKSACTEGLGALKEFFGALLTDLRKLLGLTDEANGEDQEGGIFTNLIKFFDTNEFVKKAKAWVNQAIIDVGNFIKDIPNKIRRLGANIYDTLYHLFFTEETKYNGSQLETKTVMTPLGKWMDGVIKDIREFIISLPQRIVDGVGTVFNWVNEVFDYFFGTRTAKTIDQTNSENRGKEIDAEIWSRFDEFVVNTLASIRNWFDDLPNKIRTGLKSVGSFISKLYEKIDEFLFGKKIKKTITGDDTGTGKKTIKRVTVRYKSGFSKWLDQVIKDVKKFIKKIPEYIKAGIKGAGDIVTTIINAIFGNDKGKETDSKDVEKKLEKPFLNIDLSNILNTIKDIGETLLNQIARIFTGSEEIETNQQWFADIIASGIRWIREKAYKAVKWVLAYIGSLPEKIAALFNGESETNKEKGPIGRALEEFGRTIGTFITVDLPASILGFIDSAVTVIGGYWDDFYDRITAAVSKDDATEEVTEGVDAVSGAAPKLTGWQKFTKKLGETITHIFEELPTWIAEGIELALVAINKIVSGIGGWIEGIGVSEQAENAGKQATSEITTGVAESAKDGEKEEEPRLVKAIKGIGERIKTLFIETIPTFIRQAWFTISTFGSEVWDGFTSIFTGETPDSEVGNAVATLGGSIKEFLTNTETGLPHYISEAWTAISSFGKDLYDGISSIFSGEIPTSERAQSIANIIQSVKKFLIEDLPTAISNLWKTLFSGSGGSQSWKKNITGGDGIYKQVVAAVEDQQRQANEKLKKEEKSGNFWSFVGEMGTSLLDAFVKLGPIILTAISDALDWLGNITQIVIDALTGKKSISKQIEDAYGEEKPELKNALKKIGESLKKFFLNTIPSLFGSIVGAIVPKISEAFTKMFGAFGEAADEAQEDAEKDLDTGGGGSERSFDTGKLYIETATSLLDRIKEFFKSLKDTVGIGGEEIKWLAIIIAITILFKQIAKLFSAAEVAENVGYTMKWVALTIAFSAIAGILSYITTIYESGDTEKINKIEGFIDKLKGLFDKIIWVVGIVSFGKLSDAFGNFFEMKSTKIENNGSVGGISLKDGLMGFVNNFLKTLGFGAGLDISSKLFSSATETTLTMITESFVSITNGLEDFLSGLDPIIDKINGMDERLSTAFSAVDKIKDLFAKFYNLFGDLYEEVSGEKRKKYDIHMAGLMDDTDTTVEGAGEAAPNKLVLSLSDFKKSLDERIGVFLEMANFLEKMVNTINKVGGMNNIQGNFDKIAEVINGDNFTGMFTMIFDKVYEAYFNSTMYTNYTTPTDNGMKVMNGVSFALEILANAMSVFSNGIAGLNEENVTSFEHTLDVFSKLAEAFAGTDLTANVWEKIFNGESSLSVIGRQIRLFGSYMKGFYDSIKDIPGFEPGKVEQTNNKINSIVLLAQGMTTAARDITHYGQDFEYLTALGERLPAFGGAVSEFITNVNNAMPQDITIERSTVLKNIIDTVAALMNSIGVLKYTSITSVIDGLWESMTGSNSTKLAASLKLINDALSEALTTEESLECYITAGSKIAGALAKGIQSALDNDENLHPKITPVFEFGEAEEQFKKFFGVDSMKEFSVAEAFRAALGANNETDDERVKASELYQRLGTIEIAINGISDNAVTLSDITSAFAGMKIVTDTGVLAGEMTDEIDELIGKKIWLIEQSITP